MKMCFCVSLCPFLQLAMMFLKFWKIILMKMKSHGRNVMMCAPREPEA
jgi:hypothetical protein